MLADAQATETFGASLAACLETPLLVFLRGELGAGKTTLCRGFLRGLGYDGLVRSPTYTLCETYRVGPVQCLHCDFYRLSHAEEIDYLGLREQFTADCVLLVEWPEIAAPVLPAPDIELTLRIVAGGRVVETRAGTGHGGGILAALHRELM